MLYIFDLEHILVVSITNWYNRLDVLCLKYFNIKLLNLLGGIMFVLFGILILAVIVWVIQNFGLLFIYFIWNNVLT